MKFSGTVVLGKQIGRTLGFPTANIAPDSQVIHLPRGVYAAWFFIDQSVYPCMLNIGRHPTLPEGGETIEAHLIHYSGELYGRHVSLETVRFLRGEQKFSGPEALKAQLARDREEALQILQNISSTSGIE